MTLSSDGEGLLCLRCGSPLFALGSGLGVESGRRGSELNESPYRNLSIEDGTDGDGIGWYGMEHQSDQ